MFVFVLLCITCVHFSFAIILKRKRKLVALLLLSCRCIVTINVLWLFLMVPWVGLQYVIVVFPDHTHFLFENHFRSFLECPFYTGFTVYGNNEFTYILDCLF